MKLLQPDWMWCDYGRNTGCGLAQVVYPGERKNLLQYIPSIMQIVCA